MLAYLLLLLVCLSVALEDGAWARAGLEPRHGHTDRTLQEGSDLGGVTTIAEGGIENNPICACRPILGLVEPGIPSATWPAAGATTPGRVVPGAEAERLPQGNTSGATGTAESIPLALNSGTVTYLGPEAGGDGAGGGACDASLADPRGVFLGEIVLAFQAAIGQGLDDAARGRAPLGAPPSEASNIGVVQDRGEIGRLVSTGGVYQPGVDVLSMEPPADTDGPELFYTSLWDPGTGELRIQGRTQLARQLLALDRVRYSRSSASSSGGNETLSAQGSSSTSSSRVISLTVFTANGCISNSLFTTVDVLAGVGEAAPLAPQVPVLTPPSPSPHPPAAVVQPPQQEEEQPQQQQEQEQQGDDKTAEATQPPVEDAVMAVPSPVASPGLAPAPSPSLAQRARSGAAGRASTQAYAAGVAAALGVALLMQLHT